MARGIASSPMTNTSLVAPAGAGKTTSLKALRGLYEQDGRQVVGLAPTGKAASVMTKEGATDSAQTVASTMLQMEKGKCSWNDRTVVIVDESGMVGTADLARIMSTANERGSKVVTVGDTEQLQPVKNRGGGLDLLAANGPDTQRVSEVWRQRDEEERKAGLGLRSGDLDQIIEAENFYNKKGRLQEGSVPAMLETAYQGWSSDRAKGWDSLMATNSREWADGLNRRAQAERIKNGDVTLKKGLGDLRGGRQAGLGDEVITRSNEYSLRAHTKDKWGRRSDAGAVLNGQRWKITEWSKDGSAEVRSLDGKSSTTLPGSYLRESTDLGYATTHHGVQGATAGSRTQKGSSWNVYDPDRSTRSALYVGMTRGTDENHALFATQRVGEQSHQHAGATEKPVYRHGTEDEAKGAFRNVALREDRSASALKVIAQHRQQYLSTATHRGGAEVGASTTPAGQADQQRNATREKATTRMDRMRQQLREKEAARSAGRGSDKGRGL